MDETNKTWYVRTIYNEGQKDEWITTKNFCLEEKALRHYSDEVYDEFAREEARLGYKQGRFMDFVGEEDLHDMLMGEDIINTEFGDEDYNVKVEVFNGTRGSIDMEVYGYKTKVEVFSKIVV